MNLYHASSFPGGSGGELTLQAKGRSAGSPLSPSLLSTHLFFI